MACTLSANSRASLLLVSRIKIANSSPPKRHKISVLRTCWLSRRDISRSISSPFWWPKVSLITLKWSRSMYTSACWVLVRTESAVSCARVVSKKWRLYKPVSESCIARYFNCACDSRRSVTLSRQTVSVVWSATFVERLIFNCAHRRWWRLVLKQSSISGKVFFCCKALRILLLNSANWLMSSGAIKWSSFFPIQSPTAKPSRVSHAWFK